MASPITSLGGVFRRFLGSAVSNAAGYGVGGAILPTLEPYTRDLANVTWSLHPEMPLPLNAAAEADLRGFMAGAQALNEASFTGYDSERYAIARNLRAQPLPMDVLLTLRRRGELTAGEFTAAIAQHGILERWRGKVAALLPVLPSVTDMVRFAVREVYDPAQRAALNLDAEFPGAFAADAKLIGLDAERAGQYWAAHWELPSYEQMAAMLFRGELSEGEFAAGLKALDYAPVWRPKLEAIARAIPPISDMIRFAVREVYSPDVRRRLGLDADFPAEFVPEAALHGMAEDRARQYWAAHWRLPSARQGYQMLWRGEIDQATLSTLLRALDYPPFWRERLQNIAYLVPGRIDLKRMLRHDIKTAAEVEAGYRRLGYAPADAADMTAIAVSELETSTVALKWRDRARTRLFTVAHDEYLDGSIDAGTATQMVQRVGATAAEAGQVVALWDAELGIARLELTPAQIKKAYRAAEPRFTYEQAIAELEERGMTAEDADIYLTT